MSATVTLCAPLSGVLLPLSSVPDPVFAAGLMGQGLAIEPLSATLLAPCDGDISQVSATGHAVTVRAANGAEILLHIGIDTVKLGGNGFAPRVAKGEHVRCGQALIDIDIDSVACRAPSLVTVMVVTNSDDMAFAFDTTGRVEAGTSACMSVTARAPLSPAAVQPGPAVSAAVTASAVVAHEGGLHARPCALLQSVARRYPCQIDIHFAGQHANARSVVAVMGLGVAEGDTVSVAAQGDDAAAAVAAVVAALQTATRAGHAPLAAAPASAPAPRTDGRLGGVCAAPGLTVGTLVLLAEQTRQLPAQGAGVAQELAALHDALQQVQQAVAADMAQAGQRGEQAHSGILAAHLALLDDPELVQQAERGVQGGDSAAYAYHCAIRTQSEVLLGLGNALLAERVADLKDVERRVLDVLLGEAQPAPELPLQAIVVADDLTPSQLTRLPRERLAGVVLARGGASNHVAILCRALAIPALVACGPVVLSLAAGGDVLLNATEGWLQAHADAATLDAARHDMARREQQRRTLREQASGPARTVDGLLIEVAANIANADEAREAVLNGADGVGLLRTEFLFTERQDAPCEDEQRAACQDVLDALAGRPAIIRTLDAGGDKDVPYLSLPAEDNPALGLRGIRTGFAMPLVLDVQLRALLQLQPLSGLRILLPMVTELDELLRVRQRLDELAAELGVTERPQLGVMIEVPAAALLAEGLAEHADFLSIGTNDLTQYTLAMDRCHPALAGRLDALHPAVLRLIELTVQGARRHGKWVGVCGALASEPLAVPVLLGLGVTELSVSPSLVPEIKDTVRRLDAATCRPLAQALLALHSAAQVRDRLHAELADLLR